VTKSQIKLSVFFLQLSSVWADLLLASRRCNGK